MIFIEAGYVILQRILGHPTCILRVDTWQWDRTKIVEIFAPRTCDEILAIPLSRDRNRDTLIWKENMI